MLKVISDPHVLSKHLAVIGSDRVRLNRKWLQESYNGINP